jgi:PAS domain S-box-containing protein
MVNYNLINQLNTEKFGEIFPHMENILQCGWYIHNFKDNTTHWSSGVYTIFGLEPYSLPGTNENLNKFINPEYQDMVTQAIARSREEGKPYQLEFSITDAHGLHKRVYAENYITFDKNDKPVEYSGVIKDITESYYYKKALEQKIAQLDKSNRNLQEFVYVASHDLQEPLRKISTFTERLGNKFQNLLGQEGGMFVKRILTSTHNMQTLLEDLLNFSRLSFTEKKFEKIAIKDCLEAVLSDLEVKIEEAKATVTCDNLPEIEAYPSQIKQLFNNLVGNALKFKKNDAPLNIKITCGQVKEEDYPALPLVKGMPYLKIAVEDNGIGFEPEFSERIFMIFQRLNGKAEYSGSGVGLAICKKIVENHHGFIFATSTPGEGATFTVLLPYQQS